MIVNSFLKQGIEIFEQIVFVLAMNLVSVLAWVAVKKTWKDIFFAAPVVGVLFLNLFWGPSLREKELAAYYFGIKLNALSDWASFDRISSHRGHIDHFRGPYQDIDLVAEAPREEIYFYGNHTLYLNRRPQFDLYSAPTYHESMALGALNLAQRPVASVLILGGGDGLLLNTLLAQKGIEEVVLVELDQRMLEIAQKHPVLKKLNGGVFERKDPRVTLIVGDALSYVRKTPKKYDGIFMDFPYPYSDDLKNSTVWNFIKWPPKDSVPMDFLFSTTPFSMEGIPPSSIA